MVASRGSRGTMPFSFLKLCYISLFMFSSYTLATPSNKPAPCDEVPCIAGCLSDSWATAPSSCTNDPAKAKEVECLCATVSSVAPKAAFAGCFMSCDPAEREKLRGFCGLKQQNGDNKQVGSGLVNHNKEHFSGASVDDGDDDDGDFDEETTTTSEDNPWDDDDDDTKTKSPDGVAWNTTETEDDDDDVTVTGRRGRKSDGSSMRVSTWWTTVGAVGAAVIVVL